MMPKSIKPHDDEPTFTIRATDPIGPATLAAYAHHARLLGLHDHAQSVEARAVELLQWQAAHPKLVKLPD